MKHIGVLSDTHGTLLDQVLNFFKPCDELWHAGDFGNLEVADQLAAFKPLRGVYGNIDSHDLRLVYPLTQRFPVEGSDVLIKHIGGYPGRYDSSIAETIRNQSPDIFVSGHSHILKVIYDKKYNLLHINPGSAGRSGIHKVITAIRFDIHNKDITNLEILEVQR